LSIQPAFCSMAEDGEANNRGSRLSFESQPQTLRASSTTSLDTDPSPANKQEVEKITTSGGIFRSIRPDGRYGLSTRSVANVMMGPMEAGLTDAIDRKASAKPAMVLDDMMALQLLKQCKPTEEQQDFYSIFEHEVFCPYLDWRKIIEKKNKRSSQDNSQPVERTAKPNPAEMDIHPLVKFSSDLGQFELVVPFLDVDQMKEVVKSFLNALELSQVDQLAGIDRIDRAITVCKESRTRGNKDDPHWNHPTSVSLWCRLGGMGQGSSAEATVDVGFRLEVWKGEFRGQLEWSGVDLFLPPSEDKDDALAFAMHEDPQIPVIALTASLLPNEPEAGMEFALPSDSNVPVAGLLFFRSLHFGILPDEAMKVLLSSRPWGGFVNVDFGPNGLRRLTFRLLRAEAKCAENLAKALELEYHKRDLKAVGKRLTVDEPRFIELAVEGGGWTVSLAYTR